MSLLSQSSQVVRLK